MLVCRALIGVIIEILL